MNIQNIHRLNNEYRAYIYEAESYRMAQADVASREEGLSYQRAAQICSQLASLTTGSEAQYWMKNQAACETKMRQIWAELNPEPQKKEPPAGKPAPQKPAARKDDVAQETVNNWYKEDPGYGFDQVSGMDDVKHMLSDCVRDASMEALNRYLKIPSMKSFFFYGPPGCGKTYIIEAFAHELMQQGYKFMSLSSADIHSKFSGEADKIVQRAFREAVDNAPCILFMDEVDGVCQNRNLPNLSDFNMQLTTTFLTAYNGLSRANAEQKSVIFIGATNYPANVDAAMLDRVELVRIPLPEEEVRGQVFRSALENIVRLEPGLGWLDMAVATEGYNQRDVKAIIEKLKKLIRVGAADGCTSGEEAVSRLQDGTFCLTRQMFDQAMQAYVPTPKDDIERRLNEFERQMSYM